MTDPFVAEIRLFPFNFPPKGWAWCDGQIMPIAQNTALFSLLGTTYGGDGRTTFALSQRFLGESGGSDTVTLLESEMPAHAHALTASAAAGYARSPSGELFANQSGGVNSYAPPSGPQALLASTVTAEAGGDAPHTNMAPYLVVYYCIALQGIFPQRP